MNPESNGNLHYPEYKPIPIDTLPGYVQQLVKEGAAAIHTDPSYVVMPAISLLAVAIGNQYRLAIKRNWREPAVIWYALVAPSGAGKSPAWDLLRLPMSRLVKNVMPKGRLIVGDSTTERLASLFEENPHGLLMYHDELASFFTGMVKYRQRGSDESEYLKMWQASSFTVDRETNKKHIHAENAFLTIGGGIQPAILRDYIGERQFDSGLSARFLFIEPPSDATPFSYDDVSEEAEQRFFWAIETLLSQSHEDTHLVQFEPDAKRLWVDYANQLTERMNDQGEHERATLAKMKSYAARFALILHLAEIADEVDPGYAMPARPIGPAVTERAITLTKWLAREKLRVESFLRESDDDREQRRHVKWIQGQQSFTARDFYTRFKVKSDEAEKLLRKYEQVGACFSELVHPTRGRPYTLFHTDAALH